jgi:hypothetical protein
MATPLRKDEPQFEEPLNNEPLDRDEEITTADLAQGKRPASDTRGLQAVTSDRGMATNAASLNASGTDTVRSTGSATPLFPSNELESLRTRWKEVQTAFVDEPRKAVEQADGLVASAMKRLAEVFAEERAGLEKQWDRGDSVSTEDLRIALQRYRTFFDRLLSV